MAAVDPRWRENQEVSRAASGSANELIPALARIVESGNWREFLHPMRGLQHYERLADYCTGFLELRVEAVEALADYSNAKAAARTVRTALREAIPTAGKHGTNQHAGGGSTTTSSTGRGEAYTLARLKRDRPDLAGQVVAGTLTAHAAALAAGFRHPRVSIRTDNPEAAARILAKHYTLEQITSAWAVAA